MGKRRRSSSYNPDVELAKGATLTVASYDKTQRIEPVSDKVTVGGKPGIAKITGVATGQHDASINGTLSLWLSIFRYMRPDGSIDHVAGWNIFVRLKAGEAAITAAEAFAQQINDGTRPYKAAASGGQETAEIAIIFYNKNT